VGVLCHAKELGLILQDVGAVADFLRREKISDL
jgi:hypothetical protein